ncbi:DUF1800 domain-containing protein [Mycolicibacterium mucogenicum]|uniref:DUF1800 domain-containing protein n=2 Tax=Mycolicibacterium mucogenicum TaxID=56689 RepID=A0A4R5WLM2_MYCMU|nr:DUF1800 domain-containing protein [Mycolicibacterium mucogenicum]TDK92005.1 DUF1800 domain-containing protein [Mycolicibacterium mucogenicum]
MLRRTGFGTTGAQVDAVASQNWSTYLDGVLNLDPNADPGAKATPIPQSVIPQYPTQGMSADQIHAFQADLLAKLQELSGWWLRRMAAVKEPIHEKLTLLWHNHFATSAEKVNAAHLMAVQNEKLRTLALGDFYALAYAMLSDGAMMHWLDGDSTTAKNPNENLSREFMELFCLGHGNGYTENDVREGARALTGRRVEHDGITRLYPQFRDDTTKTVLGVTGDINDTEFCDIVLSQPASAKFISGMLWRELASDQPASPETLDRLVAAYGPQRDLKALTKAVILDPEFTKAAGTTVSTPVEWLVGIIRSLAVPLDDLRVLAELDVVLSVMGQRPFYPPDVGGWPRGQLWLSTNSAAARVWAANRLLNLADISAVENMPSSDRIDGVGYVLGIGSWSDRSAAALKPLLGDPHKLVAAAVITPEYVTS